MKKKKRFSKGVFATGLYAIAVGLITLSLPISGAALAALAIAAPGVYLAGGEALDFQADQAEEQRLAERAAELKSTLEAKAAADPDTGALEEQPAPVFPSFEPSEEPLSRPVFAEGAPEAAIATPADDSLSNADRRDEAAEAGATRTSSVAKPPTAGIVDLLGR